MKKFLYSFWLLFGIFFSRNIYSQTNNYQIKENVSKSYFTEIPSEKELNKDSISELHHQAVKKYLSPQSILARLTPLLQQIGISLDEIPAFITFCEPALGELTTEVQKLKSDLRFTEPSKLDSLLKASLTFFAIQKQRFNSNLSPLIPEYNNEPLNNSIAVKLINPTHLENPPLIINGPCVNMNFADGTTNGWSGTYGTSTTLTQTNQKKCSGLFVTYNSSTDECCDIFNSCSPWTPADGYITAFLNNPYQTSGFNTDVNNASANSTNGVHVIMTGGFDPNIPGNALSVVPPSGGNSMRLGWGQPGNNAQTLRQTFLVTNNNKNFVYHFACVLNDPETGHEDYELPYFKIRMYDQNNNVISCASLDVSTANALQVGGFTKVNSQPIFWKNWTAVTVPLNAYLGQNVTIEFITSNCALSGHFGYAYVAAECLPQEIIASSPSICGGSTITLTAPPGLATYNWSGPGIQSGQGTQTVVINAAGTYQVTMTTNTTPPFTPCTFTIDTVIPGNPSRPFANFSAPQICFGSPLQFTDLSTPNGQITGWAWDFDNNGTTDNITQNPTHTFSTPGTYPVKLSVTWPPCTSDTTINVIVNPKPAVNFTAPAVCFGNSTSFTNTTNLNGASNPQYTWNFNDPLSGANNTSNLQNPTHTFTNSGTYNVNLLVNTPNCVSDTTLAVQVNALPKANFSASEVCYGSATTFTDLSTNGGSPLTSWVWIFSDPNNTNNSSNLQNPTHFYTGYGTFPVTLVVTNGNNCSKDTTLSVVVNPLPTADFAFKTFCEGITLNSSGSIITNGSLLGDGTVPAPSTISTYQWDLNNDNVFESNGQNITITQANFPAAGNYPISLVVTTNKGCRDTISGNFIVLSNPTVDAGSTQVVCKGSCTTLSGTTSSLSYLWSPAAGLSSTTSLTPQACPSSSTTYLLEVLDGWTYPVFTSTDTIFCYNSDTVTVKVNPLPVANFSAPAVCYGFTSNFSDQSSLIGGTINSWNWNFGEPASGTNNTSNLQSPTHSYLSSGNFNVTLQVTGSNNCTKDTVIQVTVHPKPTADFSFTNACADSANTFNASGSSVTSGSIANYQWDVNNSINSFEYTGISAAHTQGSDGTYDVSLVVTTNNGCKDTITKTVSVWPEPISNFAFDIVCATTATTFTSSALVNAPSTITQWVWDFDNNGTADATGANVTNAYPVGGTKTVELFVKTDKGCTDSITKQVYVNYIPTPDFTVTNKCYYEPLLFNSTSSVTGPATISTYSWQFGDGQNSVTTGANTSHAYANCNTYNVQLIVVTDSGCTANITKSAQAYCKPDAQFNTANICTYQTASFNASASSVADGTISSYQWDFNLSNPPNTFDNQASGSQAAYNYAAGAYLVGLIVTSNFGCKDTVSDSIYVYQKPTANFTPTAVCFGNASQFVDSSKINAPESIVAWAWDFMNDGSIDNNIQNPSYTFPTDGATPVKLIVTSNFNCTDTIIKNVMVNSLPKPNFTAPNVCLNNITSFTNNSTINLGTIASYSWSFGDQQTSLQISPSHLYAAENEYQVCLKAISDKGCIDSICKNVTVYPLPQANFIGTPLSGCEPLIVTFNNLSTVSSVNPNSNDQITTYSWVFGDGGVKTNNSGTSVNNTYSSGTYTVSLFVTTNNGCKGDTTFYNYVTAYPLPKAGFNFFPQPTTIAKPLINFFDQSVGADSVWWDFGDSTTMLVVNPTDEGFFHEYKDSGKYVVTQIVKTIYGCLDSIKKTVYIGPDWALYVPNAFTPNGDNINDFFMAKGYGILEFEMRIYDRWGNFIARIDNFYDKGWNGKVHDYPEDAQIDVYVYRIYFKDVFNKRHQLTGTFTLVR